MYRYFNIIIVIETPYKVKNVTQLSHKLSTIIYDIRKKLISKLAHENDTSARKCQKKKIIITHLRTTDH